MKRFSCSEWPAQHACMPSPRAVAPPPLPNCILHAAALCDHPLPLPAHVFAAHGAAACPLIGQPLCFSRASPSPAHHRCLALALASALVQVLCWKPGQVSRVHNHGTSHCFLGVLDGQMREVQYQPSTTVPPTSLPAGTSVDVTPTRTSDMKVRAAAGHACVHNSVGPAAGCAAYWVVLRCMLVLAQTETQAAPGCVVGVGCGVHAVKQLQHVMHDVI